MAETFATFETTCSLYTGFIFKQNFLLIPLTVTLASEAFRHWTVFLLLFIFLVVVKTKITALLPPRVLPPLPFHYNPNLPSCVSHHPDPLQLSFNLTGTINNHCSEEEMI